MSATNFEELKTHVGHKIECVMYGDYRGDWNVAIECEDCGEVLVDYDNEYSPTGNEPDNLEFNRTHTQKEIEEARQAVKDSNEIEGDL